jgi:hypothetical protein
VQQPLAVAPLEQHGELRRTPQRPLLLVPLGPTSRHGREATSKVRAIRGERPCRLVANRALRRVPA